MKQKELTWLYIFGKIKRVNFMEQFLLEKIKKLGIKEFENFNSLNLMEGGTAYTVDYAKQKGLYLMNLANQCS